VTQLQEFRDRVTALNIDLVKYGLVAWTAGNVSERLPDGKSFIIKPSGVMYDDLKPADLVICDLNGEVIEGVLAPSSDTKTHAYIYREMPDVNGIVHTHSNYASAWAAANKPIPCALTAMGDEFGGDIPLGPFALIGGEEIGKGVVSTLKSSNSPAVLMANHGVFTIGKSAQTAVKAAVMCEDVAKTMFIAAQLGEIHRLQESDIAKLYDRYQNVYGQSKGK
jgi:L-ribulose-5-phosphate 4-epimerase